MALEVSIDHHVYVLLLLLITVDLHWDLDRQRMLDQLDVREPVAWD